MQVRRAAARARLLRRAHRPGQPLGAARRAALRDAPRARARDRARAAGDRPRRLQARQRPLGPPGRRRRCCAPWPTACARSSARRTCSAARAATSSRCCSRTCRRGEAERVAKELAARILTARCARRRTRSATCASRSARSVGIGLFRAGRRRPPTDLVRHADVALDVAKAAGKDNVRVHRSRAAATLPLRARRRVRPRPRRAGELHRILAEGRVDAVFQPIVEIASGRTSRLRGARARARGLGAAPPGPAVRRRRGGRADGRARLGVPDRRRARRAGRPGSAATRRCSSTCEPSAIGAPCPTEHARAVGPRPARARPRAGDHRARADRPARRAAARAVDEHRAARPRHRARRRRRRRAVAGAAAARRARPHQARPAPRAGPARRPTRPRSSAPSPPSASAPAPRCSPRASRPRRTSRSPARWARRSARAGSGAAPARCRPRPATARVVRRSRGGAPPRAARRSRSSRPRVGTGEATKRLLLAMSHHLEHQALRIGEGAVILSAFQEARNFTKATVRRYETLARGASLVAAFGVGLDDVPAHGVRGAQPRRRRPADRRVERGRHRAALRGRAGRPRPRRRRARPPSAASRSRRLRPCAWCSTRRAR